MIIVVNHKINNSAEFWASAQKSLPELPISGVNKIIQVMPNNEMSEAVCVWEADSIEQLNTYLRSKVHNWSTETYFELNAPASMGVPQ
ncbi:MAG: hypothetical protein ABJA78_09575 [Ferruginibacter sp.]